MENPLSISCPTGAWTKIATNITSGNIWKIKALATYLQTYRISGEAAPTDVSEGVRMFQGPDKNLEVINSSVGIDIYIWCKTVSGAVRVDFGYGLPLNPNGGIDTVEQHQTAPYFKYDLMREDKTDITLTSDVAIDDEVINVSAGHGFTAAAGETIALFENDRYVQARVKSVATNAITIDFPVAAPFTVSGAVVIRGNVFMNVNGAVTPVTYKCQLRNFAIPIDLSTVIITMTHPLAGDDGKFGDLAELTNGLLFRKENSTKFNLGNIKKNSDFRLTGATVSYNAAAPAGSNGTDILYNLLETFQNVIRLKPADNDIIEAFVRDALTGLDLLEISLLGHYTEGEQ